MASYREKRQCILFRAVFESKKLRKHALYFFHWNEGFPMLERDYQAKLIKTLYAILPENTIILKNDPSYIQGFPDLLILCNDRWAALETKKSANSHHRPNQDYYVDRLNHMAYAAFIFPENEEEILREVQHALQPDW
jgi:hypothetical protein